MFFLSSSYFLLVFSSSIFPSHVRSQLESPSCRTVLSVTSLSCSYAGAW